MWALIKSIIPQYISRCSLLKLQADFGDQMVTGVSNVRGMLCFNPSGQSQFVRHPSHALGIMWLICGIVHLGKRRFGQSSIWENVFGQSLLGKRRSGIVRGGTERSYHAKGETFVKNIFL